MTTIISHAPTKTATTATCVHMQQLVSSLQGGQSINQSITKICIAPPTN